MLHAHPIHITEFKCFPHIQFYDTEVCHVPFNMQHVIVYTCIDNHVSWLVLY